MKLESINLIHVLVYIKIKLSAHQVVNISRSIEDARKQLIAGAIYPDELVLLKILSERVSEKVSRARGYITKLEGLVYDPRLRETSNYFKAIDVDKVKRFIQDNDIKKKEWASLESSIADAYCNKYLNL